ncbi:PREDICTED: nuclear pore complex protein NUP98A-like [Brassica oleracea var. oleracea]|uniref:nuclear pore complex protein NUP98A-like n=1 Tax=Brassica oleracea var. oleracea TaxID=109376 RepID=UPI0006A71278|nr:PREDICTED: nuclear pore complex protein NUP98A-like [Brassica oleracea var. oleracea]
MRIGVLCGCDICVHHRTQETEPSKVNGSSVPVSSGPVEALGSTSDQSSGTETPPLAPPPPEPAQSVDDAHGDASSKSSPVQTSSPPTTIFSFPPVSSQPARDLVPTGSLPGPSIGCSLPGPFIGFPSPFPTSGPSISSSSCQAPVQASAPNTASAFPPQFSYPGGGCLARPNVGLSQIVSSPFGPTHDFGVCASRTTPKDPFPGFSVDYLPRGPSGPHPQTTTPVSGGGTEQGCRYPRYSPTPDFDSSGGPAKLVMSISASNSHGHKSHQELRWEDYKNGDKGAVGSFPPPAHKPRKESRWEDYKNGDKGGFGWYPPPHHSPSLFASPSIPHRRPQMRTIVQPHGDMSSFPFGYNTPTAFQSPHELVGVSSPASGCTACGATSSSSPSSPLGLYGTTTNPPSFAASLPGLFYSTYGSCPLLFGTPNLAAYGTSTTPAVQAYAIMLGTPNLTGQGTTATPAVQAYPIMFGTPNHVAQGTTATQHYPTMFGTPNIAAQGTTTTPAALPYPMMFGTPNLAAQGTTTTPAAQPYPTMFGTPSIAAQGTTTTPAAQPYAIMFGTPNLGAQGITPAAQAYPVNGLNLLPFSAMSLQ